MTHKELYSICHDEAVAYANSEQWSKRTGEEKSFLIQGYFDAIMEMRKSEITEKKKEYPKTYEEFVELVKRMREAQCKANNLFCDMEWWHYRACELESEVDEYLKKMEE